MTVLIAYATKYGATREVAEVLADGGVECEVRDAGDVRDISEYSAVVLGSALYYFMLHGDAKRFLARNRKALAGMPVALFALGPFNDTPDEMSSARGTVDKYLAKADWLTPVAVFGGRHDPDNLRFPDNNPAMRKIPPSDARNWDTIRARAATLPPLLGVSA